MGTTFSVTVGWGFQLTEKDIEKLDRAYCEESDYKDEYENMEDFLEDNRGEGLWRALRDFEYWGDGASYFYDYYPDENGHYIYLKRVTKTYYGTDYQKLELPDNPRITNEELEELGKIRKLLGRNVTDGSFFVQATY